LGLGLGFGVRVGVRVGGRHLLVRDRLEHDDRVRVAEDLGDVVPDLLELLVVEVLARVGVWVRVRVTVRVRGRIRVRVP